MTLALRVGSAALLLVFAGLISGLDAQPPKKDVKDVKDAKDAKDKKDVKPAPITLRTACDREDATYKLDEPAVFLLASTAGGEVEFAMIDDSFKTVNDGKIRVAPGQTYKLEYKFGHPGFVRLQLTQNVAGQTATATTVAAIAPTKIEATAKPPEDFEEYWKTQREELAKIRIDQSVEGWPSESSTKVNVYRINLASVDNRRVYGWLAVPKSGGPFPAILTMPHAGVYGIKPDIYHAELGAVAMNIIIHDFPVNHPAEFYKKESEGALKDYVRIGWDDRDKCYFRYAILAGVRAIDYLSKRKDVDPKHIAVTGISQGGGLALCVSGLDDRVGFVAPDIAGLCDLNARSKGRVDGWPHWSANAPPKLKDKIDATAEYFDAVNFARKFKGKSISGVGFFDQVCPPSTVYAAFNQLPEPKIMIASPQLGHVTDPRWTKAREDFWKANLELKPPPAPKK